MLSLFFFFQQLIQPFKALVPVLLVLGSPGSNFSQGPGLQPTPASLCFASALNETGLLQDLEVFGDRWLADRQRFGQFLDGGLALREPGEDSAARRVGYGLEGRR